MQFTPRTEEEIQRDQLCQAGYWPFTVLESSEPTSKSEKNFGKPMFKLKLNVHTDDGDSHVYDYFADWFNAHKLRHFFFITGKIEEYETGQIDGTNNAFNGLTGFLHIRVKKDKKKNEMVNEIADYLTEAEYNAASAKLKAEAGDEIDTTPSAPAPTPEAKPQAKQKPGNLPETEDDSSVPF